MSKAPEKLYWEDLEVGRTVPMGEKHVTRDEIIAFAGEFDPQPFHLDDAAGEDSMLGGLAASGWHSCAIMMRMICDAYLVNSSSQGSPGLDEVKWLRPVYPGDHLRGQFTCLESRISGSRPDLGIVKVLYELLNQDDDLVMTWHCNQFFIRRDPGDAR
jgi:acyl dehydratase